MNFEINRWQNVNIIKVTASRLTFENVDQFNLFISDNKSLENKNILIDLNDCQYIDSTFLGTLVRNYISLKKADYIMKIVCNEKVNFILDDISHLGSVIEIFLNIDKALKSFE